jgi:hypothetical protein
LKSPVKSAADDEDDNSIRRIARKTAERRLAAAAALTNAGQLEGYTGPEALAKQMSMMDRIKAKAIKTVTRELGADPQQLQEVLGTKVDHSDSQGQGEDESDANLDASLSLEQSSKMTHVPVASSVLDVAENIIVVPVMVNKKDENDDSYIKQVREILG